MTAKEILAEMQLNRYDEKNLQCVVEMPDGTSVPIIGICLDDDAPVVHFELEDQSTKGD